MTAIFLKRSNFVIAIAAFAVFIGWGLFAEAALPYGAPRLSAVDSALNQLYIIDDAKNRLLVLDPASLSVIREVPLPSRPKDIIVHEPTHEVFVNSYFGGSVFIFDGAQIGRGDGSTEPKYRIVGLDGPLFVKIAPTMDAFLVFDNQVRRIYIYDLASKNLRNTLFFRDEINDWALDEGLNKLYVSSIHSQLLYAAIFPKGKLPVVTRLQPSETIFQLAIDSKRHILLAHTFSDRTIVWDTSADREIKKVNAGRTADGFPACSEKLGKCYIPNFWGHSITVFDANAKQTVKTIPLQESAHPTTISFDEGANRVLVISQADWRVVIIDGTADTVVKAVPLGIGALKSSVHSVTHDVFVPNHESGTLTVVSGADFSSRTVPALEAGKYYAPDPENLLAHPGRSVSYPQERKLYLADLGGALLVLNMDTFRVLKNIPVGERVRSMFIDFKARRLYAVSDMDHTLYVVNIDRDTLIKSVKLFDEPVGPERQYQLMPMRNMADAFLITDFHHGDLLIFDTRTNEVTKRLQGFNHVQVYGTDSSKREVYLVGSMDGRVHVLDTGTFEKKREFFLPVPNYAFAVAVDYLRHKMYYAKGPRVYVINPENGSLLKTILLKHPGAISALVLPELNRLYVALHHGIEAVDLDRDEVVAAFDVENHHNSLIADRTRGLVYAYTTDVVASESFIYGFDARSDAMISKVAFEQTLPSFAVPSIDPLSGRIFAPESYAQEIKVVDTKNRTSRTVTAVPERRILGLSVTTIGMGIMVIAIAIALGYFISRRRAGRVA